ncbi:adenylate/guanylate cyclase domain-containing protein [Micropruina sonneratiae]|uniref:adenylate/guanylate cyclase domain-containing protein n=1 Tax=Micropruina sonneratiae TaxID=2986940 RepID=UPI002225E66C|nr:adenylate/guanylate cyclase domain-containing protein [Micropruina sp. KQZ13P-5]MCW3158521.1 AAA family ATPase [Micropruina sp. KQZ13P-5]
MAVIRCGACGSESTVGKRFCADCGTPLQLACPSCGGQVGQGQRFCGDCGTPLTGPAVGAAGVPPQASTLDPATSLDRTASQAAPLSQRRLCSVLFVDLVGFTTVSEARDPEEVRELLSGYFDLARTVVGRYGGTIEKFIGDAVMAVWGTPVATELDAERAVRAALDLVDGVQQLGAECGIPQLTARAGVLTGEVAVTIGATNQGMVAGDAVNTAARIQSAAAPGTVYIDATTQRLTADAILAAERGPHLLKGKTEPEPLWQATQVVSATGGTQRVDGLEAPLIGRNAEFRSIREMFHASADRRQPRLVLVTGPAGVGKSRLGWEFEKYVDGLVDTTLWHRGRCLAYGQGMVYWALAEVVRQRFRIAEDDPPDVAAARFAEGLDRWVPDAAERDFIAPRLGRLIGVAGRGDSGASLAREDLFAGWRRFFERLAATHPVTILIEDLHHGAADLLDFLDHLVDWAHNLPIFVLAFGRSELELTNPGFGSGRNRATIALDPLDATSMDAIVDALVPGMPAVARRQITERSEGIPLYAVESIRALVDRGVIQETDAGYRLVGGAQAIGRLAVPDSLRALLAARLDALDPVARRVVADASVLGATFPAEALMAVSGLDRPEASRVLADLLRREVFTISADPLSPQRGNYGFAQEMLRQVAYDTLSRRDRKTRHLRVAQHLRDTFPNDGEEVVDAVARHYADALDAAPEDADRDEIQQQLVSTLVRAAERSRRTGAPGRAAESFAAAADLLVGDEPLTAARLLIRAADTGGVATDQFQIVGWAERAGELARAAGAGRIEAIAMMWKGRSLRRLGRHTEARELLSHALSVLRTDPDLDTLDALESLASLETFAGTTDGLTVLGEMFELANKLGVDDQRFPRLLVSQAIHHENVGEHRLAEMYFREAIRYAERDGLLYEVAEASLNLGNALLCTDPRASIEPTQRAIDAAVESGGTYLLGTAFANLAYAHLQLEDWDKAEQALHSPLLEVLDEESYIMIGRALLHGLRGESEAARQSLARLSDEFMGSEDPQDRASLASAKAALALADGDLEGAFGYAISCLTYLGTQLPFGGDDGRIVWPLAARAAHELGRFTDEADLLAAYEAQPKGAVAPLQRAEAELVTARLAAVSGDQQAAGLFDKAVATVRRISPPYNLAHALLDHAEYLLGAGEGAGVAALIDEALAIAVQLRCLPLAARAETVSAAASAGYDVAAPVVSGPSAPSPDTATGGISPQDPARTPAAEGAQVR